MTVKQKWLVTAGAAALISGAIVSTATAQDNMGQCHGINSCKGQSACQTAESSCAGQNNCKGKGWVKTEQADCEKQGGEFKPLK